MSKIAPPRSPLAKSVKLLSASEAKSIGQILDLTEKGGTVGITRYGHVKAMVIPIDEYRQLTELKDEPELGHLEQEFEAMLAGMQTQESRTAIDEMSQLSPKEMGLAAVMAASPSSRHGA